jgi:DNA-binding NtrC family response regulator
MKPKILLVDDDEGIQFGFTKYLNKAGYEVTAVSTLSDAKSGVLAHRYDAVLLDLILPDGNGIDWIGSLRENYPNIAIVVITGVGDIPLAVRAMSLGADNFLTKPVNMRNLDIFLRKSLELEELRKSFSAHKRMEKTIEPYFGESTQMKKLRKLVTVAAENDSAVLLQGETGTGKGVMARWIHDHSSVRESSFVELNCSGLRGELLASELFGHAKGAFTSAVKDKQGLLQVADGGTLFLDEIGDMDMSVQAQFLKVIEEKRYRRLGEVKERRSEFRLICSTNRNLLQDANEGSFRKDLFFRINIFPLTIPPLRERKEDIPGLILYLLRAMDAPRDAIGEAMMDLLISYPWPGNVREARNVLERALLLAQSAPLSANHFPGLGTSLLTPGHSGAQSLDLQSIEASHILSVLKTYEGDTQKAAQALGISRASLYRRMKKLNIPTSSS